MTPWELELQNRQTRHFIESNPVEIMLFRTTKTPNLRGGHDKLESLLSPVTARIITSSVGATTTIDGTEIRVNIIVVFYAGTDVQPNDEFDWDNMRFRIIYVDKTKPYQVRTEAAWVSN